MANTLNNSLDEQDLARYLLRIGDTCLILGHRMSELMGHAPVLEEDLSIANIALEQVDQARAWLTLASELENNKRSEDALAYLRDEHEFFNLTLAEQPNGHFGDTVARQLLVSAWQREWYGLASQSSNKRVQALAQRFLPQAEFHWRWARDWLQRLGDGTPLSHERMQHAIDSLWRFSGELFDADDLDRDATAAGIIGRSQDPRLACAAALSNAFESATLTHPATEAIRWHGKRGEHGETLGLLLAEMQSLARAHPGANW
jgi:ring-1,2-phenylacetyl-CoA epoxidase subunit PaaC